MEKDLESHQKLGLLENKDMHSLSSSSSAIDEELEYPIFPHREGDRLKRLAYSILKLAISIIAIASLSMNIWMTVEWSKLTYMVEAYRHNDASTPNWDNFPHVYSPAENSIQYELKSLNFKEHDDIFAGPPTDETDLAWTSILRGLHIRVTGEELKKAKKQSTRLHVDEDNVYIGYLEVYHQLHCLKRMMQNRWPERYPEVAKDGSFHDGHFNHCMQVLRKGIMCKPDITLNTWMWNPANETDLKSITTPPRTCINWDRFHSWALSRAIHTDIKTLLASPDEEGWLGPDL